MPQTSNGKRNGFDQGRYRDDFNGAESEADKHIRDIEKYAEMHFTQGKRLASTGKLGEAIDSLRKASDLVNDTNPTYLIELAQAHEQLEEFEKAYQTLSQAIWLKPRQLVSLFFQRGLVASRQGKSDLANEDFGRVINTFIGTTPALPEDRKLLANAFHQRGKIYRRQGKLALAMEDIERALQFDPQLADACFVLGCLHQQQGRHEDAVRAFQRALQIVESFDDAHSVRRSYTYHRGLSLLDQRKYPEAIADFTAVLEASGMPPHDELHFKSLYDRGRAHHALQAHQAAVDDLTQVLNTNANHIDAFLLRSEAHTAMGQMDHADLDVKKALNGEPDFAACHFQEAMKKLSSAPHEAIEHLKEAIRHRKGVHPEGFYHLGLLRQRIATEMENAISDFKTALVQQPDHEYARYQLGRTYEALGKHGLAIDQYSQMVNDGLNKYPFVYIARARCHQQLGNREQAISDLRKAKKLEAGSR